jgi:ATP-dependent Clp protease ATP-binding subunit ClpB
MLRNGKKVDSNNPESNYNALEKYAKNLNVLADKGKLDPVIGIDEKIRRVLQILSRRTKNNPILVGEPGVGKTAIAEGLANRIVQGDVPENLKGKVILRLYNTIKTTTNTAFKPTDNIRRFTRSHSTSWKKRI